jgi:beta-glucosidase
MLLKRLSAFALLCVSLSAITGPSAGAQARPFSTEAKQKAEALLKQMTVDEEVGQLNQSAGIVMPEVGGEKPDELITQGKVGSILWLNDVKEINRLQRLADDCAKVR